MSQRGASSKRRERPLPFRTSLKQPALMSRMLVTGLDGAARDQFQMPGGSASMSLMDTEPRRPWESVHRVRRAAVVRC
jgi:hypothetical protein